jgi:hypothetical protein
MSERSVGHGTRQRAIGRFRRERMSARPGLLESRQEGVLSAAESVSRLIGETRAAMGELRRNRADSAAALRQELGAFRDALALRIREAQATQAAARAAARARAATEAAAFRAELRANATRIVTEDFAGA